MQKFRFFFLKKATLPGRYIFATTLIFAAGIIAVSLVYHLSMTQSGKLTQETLLKTSHSSLLINARTVSVNLASPSSFTPEQIRARLDLIVSRNSSIITAVLYSRTPDENFFKPVYSVNPDSGFSLPIEKGAAVKQQNSSHYLKKGLTRPGADPAIYSHNGNYWQNIYVPVRVDRRTHVVQFFISSEEIISLLDEQKRIRDRNIRAAAVSIMAIIAALAAAGGWFYYNFTHLITRLTYTVDRAASGDPEARLNENAADPSLAKLASSFNELVTEFQEAKSAPRADISQFEGADTRELFSLGVMFIKEGRLDESVTIFKTITGIKPGSFSGFFNLGVAYARSGMRAEAVSAFEAALKLNPSHEKTSTYISRIKNSRADENRHS